MVIIRKINHGPIIISRAKELSKDRILVLKEYKDGEKITRIPLFCLDMQSAKREMKKYEIN